MASSKYKIFLVDDDSKHLMLLKSHIEKRSENPVEIEIFSDGESALDAMAVKAADVVILDYYLDSENAEAKDGLTILKALRAVYPDTEVIMMSGQEEMQVAIDSFEVGAYDYIIKNETAFLRASIIVRNILQGRNAKSFFKEQKKVQAFLIFLVFVAIGVGFLAAKLILT